MSAERSPLRIKGDPASLKARALNPQPMPKSRRRTPNKTEDRRARALWNGEGTEPEQARAAALRDLAKNPRDLELPPLNRTELRRSETILAIHHSARQD